MIPEWIPVKSPCGLRNRTFPAPLKPLCGSSESQTPPNRRGNRCLASFLCSFAMQCYIHTASSEHCSSILPAFELCINGIIHTSCIILFCIWLCWLNIMFLKFIHVIAWSSSFSATTLFFFFQFFNFFLSVSLSH